MKRTLALLFTALALFTLSGCADWDEGTYSNDPLGELAKYYQTDTEEETPALTVFALPYLGGETLDPITCADGVQLTLSTLLYEPLYRLTPQFEVENVLAQSESYDAESFTYTIRLRSGVQFSDGSPLTAQDVAYTLLRAQQSSRYAARLADVTAVKAQDSNTLTIQLAQDRRTFTALLDIPIVRSGTETQLFPVAPAPMSRMLTTTPCAAIPTGGAPNPCPLIPSACCPTRAEKPRPMPSPPTMFICWPMT